MLTIVCFEYIIIVVSFSNKKELKYVLGKFVFTGKNTVL